MPPTASSSSFKNNSIAAGEVGARRAARASPREIASSFAFARRTGQFRATFQFFASGNLHSFVAFLPFAPVRLKALKTKEDEFSPRTISEHLRRHRFKLGINQRQAAERLGGQYLDTSQLGKSARETVHRVHPRNSKVLRPQPHSGAQRTPRAHARLSAGERIVNQGSRPSAWCGPRDLGRLGAGRTHPLAEAPESRRHALGSRRTRSRRRDAHSLEREASAVSRIPGASSIDVRMCTEPLPNRCRTASQALAAFGPVFSKAWRNQAPICRASHVPKKGQRARRAYEPHCTHSVVSQVFDSLRLCPWNCGS
jgi:hypothetical protein